MDKKYAKYILNKTREDYNLISDDFSRTREYIWEELIPLLDNNIKKGDIVLDLGCGNGRYYDYLKKKEANYVGIDNSEKLIEIAGKKHPLADFRTGDALNLPFKDDYFDKIIAVAVLHHIPSEEFRLRFLKEIKRVLKDNGVVIITVWKFHRKKEKKILLKHTLLKLIGMSKLDFKDILEPWGKRTERYYRWFSEKELISLAKKAGFKVKDSGQIENKRGNRKNIYLVAAPIA